MASKAPQASAALSGAPAPYANASLYVGDLAPEVSEAMIFETFNAIGPVQSVRVCRDSNTRRSLGYAYVNFHRSEDASRAMNTLNYGTIHNQPCRIMWSQRDPTLRKSGAGNIFINGLVPSIDNKALYDTFSTFGDILSCKVARRSGDSLGYGFVHYESDESAKSAIEKVDGKLIEGSTVHVTSFVSREDRLRRQANRFTNVFVKNLPVDITEPEFRELFGKFGNITSVKLGEAKQAVEGKLFNRFGFINYDTNESAVKAIEAMHEYELNDLKLYVAKHQKSDQRREELKRQHEQARRQQRQQYRNSNLYVKNLADDITDEKLAQTFARFGTITSAKIMMDRERNKSRGFGFVCFQTPEEATRAVSEMNNQMMNNKPLFVTLAQTKEERRRKLEAEYAQRNTMRFQRDGGQQMYPRVFYQNPPVPMYNQQMAGGMPWVNQSQPQMMLGGQVPMQARSAATYALMPMQQGRQQGGRTGRGRGGRQQNNNNKQGGPAQVQGQPGPAQGQPQMNVRYNPAVRNPQMPGQPQQQGPQQGQQQGAGMPPQQGTQNMAQQRLTSSMLLNAPRDTQKQMIGERLFPLVQRFQPEKAGKITGMLLELELQQLIELLESEEALRENISEALNELDRGDEEESDEESDEDQN